MNYKHKVLLLLATLSISIGAFSQNLNLRFQNITVRKAIIELKQKTGYSFVYERADLDTKKKVTVNAQSINEAVRQILQGQNATYEIQGKSIIVRHRMSVFTQPRKEDVQQQKSTIKASGRVTDEKGEPIIGATVMENRTKNGTVTDINGHYSLDVSAGNDLLISYIGYRTKQVRPNTNEKIVLNEDYKALNEVVVVGYGSMQKREVTSSITSVKGDELIPGIGGSTIATALQGKVSGLTISGTSSPNSSNGFQLRGVASVNAGKGPLVVIDGIPGGDLRALNQEDIASIDVLKDASAGAIYGTRAAGGVILVTTKHAKKGKVNVSYTIELSKEVVRKKPELLSASEYVADGIGQNYGSRTNWYDALIHKGNFSNRHVLNFSGGSDKLLLYTTLTYQNQEGIVIGDNRKDYSGRMNAQYNMFDGKVKFIGNVEYREAIRDQRNSSELFNMAMTLNPTSPLYDSNDPSGYNLESDGISGTDFNPVADVMLRTVKATDQWLLANATLKIDITNDLNVQGTLGYQKSQWENTSWVSANHRESLDNTRAGEAYQAYSKDDYVSAEAYATYRKIFGENHSIQAVGGWSFWESNGENFNMTNYNFPVEGVGPWDMASGSYLTDGRANMNSAKDPRERLLAFFVRANYSYADKYILMASIRHEGSSKFGPDHRWGNFWAVSGGWRISSEKFMQNFKWINDLKLRVGYGITGNNDFGSGYTVKMYKSNDMWPILGTWTPAYGQQRNINPDLKWEQNGEWNIGLDYSILNNRIYGKFDWYYRRVKDLLYEVNAPVPPMSYTTIMKNIGNLMNRGWEFEVGADVIRNKDFKYSSTLRFSHNTTKLLNIGLGEGQYIEQETFPSPGNPGSAIRLMNNQVIGKYFLFKNAGVDKDGKWLIYDKDNQVVQANDKTLISANKHFTGNAIPKLILSWDNTVSYKNWDFGIYLRSWLDFDAFSQPNMYYGLKTNSQSNVLKKIYEKNKNVTQDKILSDYWLDNASFLKIDAITVGYKFNTEKALKYIDNIRVYCTARNVATITGYNGLNPEVDINGLAPGFERIKTIDGTYPQTIHFTLGVQVNL
ncbi:SusC/RagA family TonB-linked outer membrane protein [Segatella asaccharophila]